MPKKTLREKLIEELRPIILREFENSEQAKQNNEAHLARMARDKQLSDEAAERTRKREKDEGDREQLRRSERRAMLDVLKKIAEDVSQPAENRVKAASDYLAFTETWSETRMRSFYFGH